MAPHSRPEPAILRLPLEIRQLIYAELLAIENVSHPLPSVGITSVDRRPPSAALLNIHHVITDEILDYFYSISTWKLVFSHAFNFFRVDPELRKLEQSPSLACIRRVEVVFFCDVLLLQNYPSFGLESFCAEIKRRASRACDVLCQAKNLQTVIVSWCDSTSTGNWEEKARIVEPLRKITQVHPQVKFKVGSIAADDVDEEEFAKTLQKVLGAEQRVIVGCDEELDDPASKLRLLAFDPRQERLKLSSKPGEYPAYKKTGWRGAPPLLTVPREQDEWQGSGDIYCALGAQQIGGIYSGPSPS